MTCWRSECRDGCYYPDVCSEHRHGAPRDPGCLACRVARAFPDTQESEAMPRE